jgi:hypothetical protein
MAITLGHPFTQPAASWAQRKWRLVERDLVIAEWATGVYVVTDDDPIDGGSRWAVARAYELHRPVVRVDSTGRLHPDPAIVPAHWQGAREAPSRIATPPTGLPVPFSGDDWAAT